jgi:Family of unknown function (DUF5723)
MHIRSISFILFFFIFCTLKSQAQTDLMLSQQPNVWHANTAINPAFFPKDKNIAIGLPAISVDLRFKGLDDLAYRDFVREVDGVTLIDLGGAIGKLDATNTIQLRQRTETASVGLRLGKTTLMAHHGIRVLNETTFPRNLIEMLWNGNAQFIGQDVQIAPVMTTYNWHEFGIGAARQIGSVNIAARAKWLQGSNLLATDPNAQSISINTSDDVYQLRIATNYGFHATNIIQSIDTSGLGYELITGDFGIPVGTPHRGLAWDLGATWQASERLLLHASALDLGASIQWKNTSYYRSQGQYEFDGVTIPGSALINGEDFEVTSGLDSLNDIYQFERSAADPYKVRLPFRMYAGAHFNATKRLAVGASFYREQAEGLAATTAAGVSAQWTPLRWITVGAQYSVNNRSATNLGASVLLGVAGVQTYIASDNVLDGFSKKSATRFNLRAGVSLSF